MADNTLSFETRVDLSGLNSATDEIKSKFDAVSSTMTSAMDRASQATKNLSEAQIALGSAAARGSEAAATVIRQYAAEVENANAAIKQAQQVQDAAASSAEALATTNNVLAASQENVARSASHQLTELQATSAITRELSGGASIRAVENFLSKTLGLGPAMQAIFPVAGAIAFGEIIFDVGKKLYDAFDLGGERARQAAQDIAAVDLEVQRTSADLEVTLQRLIAQRSKLEGQSPKNGLALELAEATAEALKLDAELERVNKQRENIIGKDIGPSIPQRLLGQSGTHDETVMLEEHTRRMNAATTAQEQLNEQTSYGAVITQKLHDLQGAQSASEAGALTAAQNGLISLNEDYSKQIEAVQQLIKWKNEDQKTIETSQAITSVQSDVTKLQGNKIDASAASRAASKDLKDIEDSFAALHTKLPEEAAAFWQSYLGNFEEGSKASGTEYTHVVEQINHFNDAFEKGLNQSSKLAAEVKRMNAQSGLGDSTALTRAEKLGTSMAQQTAPDIAGQQHAANAGNIQIQEAKAQAGAALGITDPTKDLQLLASLHQQAIAEDEDYIKKELLIYADEPKKVEQLQQQLLQVQQRGNIQQIQDTTKVLEQQEEVYKKTYQAITNDFNSTVNKLITTNEKPAQAFGQMFDSILSQLATFELKWLEKKAAMWLQDELLTTASQTKQSALIVGAQAAQTSAVVAGQATQATATVAGQAAQKAADSTTITHDAGVAAANVYKTVSAIPIVGPVLAPVAAGVAYGAVTAFAAFEAGGVVNGSHGMPVPIVAHAGERVLSAPQTANFDRMVNSSQGGSAPHVHLNYSPNINAFDRTGFKSTLSAHAGDIHEIVMQGMRSGAIKGRA